MTLLVRLLIGFLSGVALGSAFFGALWWSVQGLPTSERPTRRMAVSFLLRMGLLAVGLALLARLGPLEVLSGLAGILTTRFLFIRSIEVGDGAVDPAASAHGGSRC